jgi:hypothetical protein
MKQGFLGTIGWIKGNLMSNPNLLDKNYNNENFYPGAPDIPNSAVENIIKILPTDVAGLCLCLDAEINSRQGIHDESINGMQNLVYAPITGNTNTTGCLEKLNGTATFIDKGVKLGGTCFYPTHTVDDLTIEFCMELGEPVDINGHHWIFVNGSGGENGRNCIIVDSEVVGFYGLKSGVNVKSVHAKHKGNKIHYAVTTKLTSANSTKVYIDGVQVTPESTAQFNTFSDLASPVLSSSSYNSSFGGMSSVKTTSVTYNADTMYAEGGFWCPNDIFHSFRLWSRQLSPEEIQANYQADKRRFG